MLKVGDVVATRNIRAYFTAPEAKGWGEYKAEKGNNMAFLYLGQEPIDGSNPLNPDEVLKKMGWELRKE